MENIPYVAHEAILARQERTIRRFFVIIILLIVLLVGTNAAWLYYESQFEDTVTTVEADTDDGGTAIANMDGEVRFYGEGENNN